MSNKNGTSSLPNWFVDSVEPRSDGILFLIFHDGSRRLFDCKKLFGDSIFESLKRPDFFRKAHLEGHSVVWDDTVDIDSEYLYKNSAPIRL